MRRLSSQKPSSGYDCFISYSRAADAVLAPALQAALQSLAKPWYRRRMLHVFRDASSLSASPGLWAAIEAALGQARYLVLLLSPEAAASRWIAEEISWWKEHREPATTMLVLTSGTLTWDVARADFSEASTVPDGLRGWFPAEPLWVDLTWFDRSTKVGARHPQFRAAVAAIAAPLRGLPKDDLIGEDLAQHRRALRLARAAAAALAVLAAAAATAAVVAVGQRDAARRATRLAIARQLAASSATLLGSRLDAAQFLASAAFAHQSTPQTRAALFDSLVASPRLAQVRDARATITALATGTSGAVLTGGADGHVRIWRAGRVRGALGLRVAADVGALPAPVTSLATNDGRALACSQGTACALFSLSAPGDRRRVDLPAHGDVALGRASIASVTDTGDLELYDLGGRLLGRRSSDDLGRHGEIVGFSTDGASVLVGTGHGEHRSYRVADLVPLDDWSEVLRGETNQVSDFAEDRSAYVVVNRERAAVTTTATPARHDEFPVPNRDLPNAIAIAPGDARVALATEGAITVASRRGTSR